MSEIKNTAKLPFFERYLSFWVILCIVIGVIVGKIFPGGVNFLSKLEVSQVNIPVAILIWLMIYPMMVQIDFSSIVKAGKKPKTRIVFVAPIFPLPLLRKSMPRSFPNK